MFRVHKNANNFYQDLRSLNPLIVQILSLRYPSPPLRTLFYRRRVHRRAEVETPSHLASYVTSPCSLSHPLLTSPSRPSSPLSLKVRFPDFILPNISQFCHFQISSRKRLLMI